MNKTHMVYVTFGNQAEAQEVAEQVIEHKLAACANILSPINSIFIWQNKLERTIEYAVLFKTEFSKLQELEQLIKERHSYDCPCILSWAIDHGSQEFCNWIHQQIQ